MRQDNLDPSPISVYPDALPIGFDQADLQQPAVEVRETDFKGKGVFSLRQLSKDDVAIVGIPTSESPKRNWKTLQMDVDTHVLLDAPFEYVNHSCDPNCGIKPNQNNGYNLVAMRPIAFKEEITFDYCMTEWICVGFRDCSCGSDSCRKVIRGAKYLQPEKLMEYAGYTAPYFTSLLPHMKAGG